MSVRYGNLAIVIAAHAAAIAALVSLAPVRQALVAASPVFVSFVSPEAPGAPPTSAEPQKPKPAVKPERPRAPKPDTAPVLTAAPAPAAASPVQPSATRAAEVAPAPEPASSAPPGQAALVPPSFSADYLHNPAPAYPSMSRRLGEEGKVVVRVLVDPEGLPARVELRASSGFPRLDEVALETVRKWKFVPAKQGDRAVAAWVLVPISFSLKG
ncbi:MAG: TonB family protein [Burkholderiales bacterium]|nr:TonB family protein [Burkholderiales bacterium]